MDSSGKKTIWDVAQELGQEVERDAKLESNLVIVGSKQGGKTSLIYRFIDRNENPKPTLALEYLFARRQRPNDSRKDVCNIWELGGGTLITNLLDFVIKEDTLRNTSICIIVDLSAPEELTILVEQLLAAIQQRIWAVLSDSRQQPYLKEELMNAATKRIHGRNNEKKQESNGAGIEAFPLPLLIIGSKYDIFQDYDLTNREAIGRYLRLVAHNYGAALQYVATKSETLVAKMRATLSHLAFGTPVPSYSMVTDYGKPLWIPWGGDSFHSIGEESLDAAKRALTTIYPQVAKKVVIPDDPAKDPNFKERDIDLIRAQKDKELEELKRIAENRLQTTSYRR